MAKSYDQNEIDSAYNKLVDDTQNSCLTRMMETASHSCAAMWLSQYQGNITPAMLDIFERDTVDLMDAACKDRDSDTMQALFTTASGREFAKLVNSYYENPKRWENIVIHEPV